MSVNSVSANVTSLARYFFDRRVVIDQWLQEQFALTPPVITTSVDLRNAGYKFSPVDTNLFPAGFNNLSAQALENAVTQFKMSVSARWPGCQNVLLIPENQSRNPFYWESLANLRDIIENAGYSVRVGFLVPTLTAPKTLELASGRHLTIEPLCREEDRIKVGDFIPDMVLLNNDLAGGVPEILNNIAQALDPTSALGWCSRLKSQHFSFYQTICKQFAQHIGIDPWLISPLSLSCGMVNFATGEGESCVQKNAQALLEKIQAKYDEYQIELKPFVVVKADMGTYGMGVIMVDDAEKIAQLNRKQRNRMVVTKDSQALNKVIIQEGVPTVDTQQHLVAERVMYLIAGQCVGGFHRMHAQKSATENLNSPGMQFSPYTLTDNTSEGYLDCVIARLAALAAAHELASLEQPA